MELKRYFLEQLEQEVAANRKALERVPEHQPDWKPHAKSMPLGYLSTLVATMPAWAAYMIDKDELDISQGFRPQPVETRAELVKLLDQSTAKARTALQNTNEEHLMKNWRLLSRGQVMSESPRYLALMNGLFSHLAHHRGQLTVYLRLNEASVPALFGPSADEFG
jgi:uncharacterized damage-inducible protein DinB